MESPRDTILAQRNQVGVRYHSDNIRSQIAALQDVGSHRKMIVHADSADPHVAKCFTEYMDHNLLKNALHLPYLPDLAPIDLYLFGYVKHQLQGDEFTEGTEFVSPISEIVNQIPTHTLADGFDDCMRRLQPCIDIIGEYVE
jgi:hypothetical protein